MSRHEVKFIYRRTESIDSDVEYIGGYNSNGSLWKMTVERAIEGIENGKWEFFLVKNDTQLNIVSKVVNEVKKLCIDISDFNYIEL